MSLQALDLVVVLTAARLDHDRGAWMPTDVRSALGLPWSTLHRSLKRLEHATLLREGRVNRIALATLLPVLRYLFPLEVDTSRTTPGQPTGHSTPVFQGRIRGTHTLVWADEAGPAVGHPVVPLFAALPALARQDPDVGALFGMVDALRGGRAREVGIALRELRQMLSLPAPLAGA